MQEDREMFVRPGQLVKTAWIDIDLCRLGNRERMDVAAVERAFRKCLQLAPCASWPPPYGHWEEERFVICDGRHEYLARLAMGQEKIFVAWLE